MRFLTLPLLLVAGTASAQDMTSGNHLSFTLGVGAGNQPAYFGADHSNTGVTGSISDPSLSLGSFGFGGDDAQGFGLTGSFRYIGSRTAADNPELAAYPDIDAALEVGGGFTYSTDATELFVVGRYGIIGHEAFVGEIGGDLIMQPNAQTEIRFGPRLFFGDDSYTETYFGTGADDRKGGLLSRGLEASISYDISDDWGVVGTVNYDELVNDAASSPIVQSTDQLGVSLMVTRNLSWSF